MGGPTFPDLLRGVLRRFPPSTASSSCASETAVPHPRARSLQFFMPARDEGVDGEGERGKGCLLYSAGNRLVWEIMGHPRRAVGLAKRDFIPPLSEGNKCRGTFDQPTDVSRRAASARRPRCDSDRRLGRKICISGRDDNRALLSNNAKDRRGKLGLRFTTSADTSHLHLSNAIARATISSLAVYN